MKKLLSLVIIFLMVFSSSITTYGYDDSNSNNNYTKSEIEEVLKKYGFELIENYKEESIISFNSLDELEKQLEKADKLITQNEEQTVFIDIKQTSKNSLLSTSDTYEDSHTFSWYNPFAGFDGFTLLTWSNIYIAFTYKFVDGNPQYVSLDNCTSKLSGLQGVWWDQHGYIKNFTTKNYTKDTISLTVSGDYVLGIAIGDFQIGLRRPADWEVSLTLVNK